MHVVLLRNGVQSVLTHFCWLSLQKYAMHQEFCASLITYACVKINVGHDSWLPAVLVWGTSPFARERKGLTILLLRKLNVIFTTLWTALKWLLTKIIACTPMIVALRIGAIQSRSRIARASTACGEDVGHALDHTVIWMVMSTFQTWAQITRV